MITNDWNFSFTKNLKLHLVVGCGGCHGNPVQILGPVYTGADKFLHREKLAWFHLAFTRERRNWTNT